jgi:3-hydroxybutyrate dehydrogenase
METLLGKNALVTGSTSGIGLAIAKALAKKGCNLMIGGFAPAGVPERLCKEISTSCGVKVIYSGADLSNPEEARKMVADTIAGLGSVDILVNDAGLQLVAPITEFPDEKWDLLTAVMLDAQFHTIKAALPGMIAKKWGRIINIASVHGAVGSPHKVAYIAAKHGVVGLTKAVALEVAETGVTCNAIGPGLVLTDLIRNQLPAQAKMLNCTEEEALKKVFLANTPTQRGIDPTEIGETAAFLCSEGARSITGTTVFVDGGYTAR